MFDLNLLHLFSIGAYFAPAFLATVAGYQLAMLLAGTSGCGECEE